VKKSATNIKGLKRIRKVKKDFYKKHEMSITLKADFVFYKRWKYIIKLLVYSETIIMLPAKLLVRNFRAHRNFIVVGLKWYGMR
jgi:hypothetical protein